LSVAIWIEWRGEFGSQGGTGAIRRKGLWLAIKSIFAPTEVATSLALIVLVMVFALVYFGARHRPSAATHSSPAVVSETSPAPDQVSPSPSADRSPLASRATDNGLGTVIRAALAATHRRGPGVTPSPVSPTTSPTGGGVSPTPSAIPTDTATPTPSPTDIPTPTPSPTDIPTPTPSPTDSPTPSPS